MAVVYWKEGPTYEKANNSNFTNVHSAGAEAPFSGLYQCPGCTHIIVSTAGNKLPPQNHHQHTSNQGVVRWQLIVSHS